MRWSEGWDRAKAAAAALGGARGGCKARTHASLRFLARGAHLARAVAAGREEASEGGDGGAGHRTDEGRRAGAVDPSRGDLGRTCPRIQAHERASR